MNICEECGRTFATPQAVGAHRALYHRVSEAELRVLKADALDKANWIRILSIERQASTCPHCGNFVGWSSLPIKECPLKSYERGNPEEWCIIRGNVEIVKYRRCPVCGYFEKEQRQ